MTKRALKSAPPPSRVRSMFDDIVERYDVLNGVLSFGLDGWWRRRTAGAVHAGPGNLILDVGTGTGDLARLLSQRGGQAVGVDLSHRMLTAARTKAVSGATFTEGSVFALPFGDATFDGVVSAFVLRNLDDLAAAFAEVARVVKPTGRIAMVDITEPERPLLRKAFDAYFRVAAPAVGRLAGKADAYRYLAASLAQLPPPREVAGLMRRAGFADVVARPLTGGMVTLFTAVRAKGEA